MQDGETVTIRECISRKQQCDSVNINKSLIAGEEVRARTGQQSKENKNFGKELYFAGLYVCRVWTFGQPVHFKWKHYNGRFWVQERTRSTKKKLENHNQERYTLNNI